MASLFGWEIQRKTDADEKSDPNNTKGQQFAPPASDDGALAVMDVGTHNTFLDVDGTISSEIQLLTRYREMSLQPEIAKAIDDIVNEVIAYDEKAPLVSLNMDNLKDEIPDRLRDVISNEFDNILRLYDFNNSAYEIVRRWYIDGRMYYQALIDIKNPTAGIQELRYIDPRLIHKVRKIKRSPAKNGTQASVITKITEYYVYRDKAQAIKPMNTTTNYYQGTDSVKISKDAIIHATSGLMDPTNTTVLSYLHKANRPLNQLRAIENASVINRLVRAPMRRKFTVEMGALPKAKGEQYLRDQMTKYKNKLTYDSTTGTLKDNRHFMTMLEDFWFASRRGIKSVDVENLQGAGDWKDIDDLTYFKEQLLQSLNIPVERLMPTDAFNLGRPSQTTREELKFSKFISRLRLRFNVLFKSALSKQLILKGILNEEECLELMSKIAFDYKHDNYFAELKQGEIDQNRFNSLALVEPFVGKYVSQGWVKRNVLHQTDEEMEQEELEMQNDIIMDVNKTVFQMEQQIKAGVAPQQMGQDNQDQGVNPDTLGAPPQAPQGQQG